MTLRRFTSADAGPPASPHGDAEVKRHIGAPEPHARDPLRGSGAQRPGFGVLKGAFTALVMP